IQQPDLVGKRLELLRQAIPQLQRLGILADTGYAEPMLEADRVKSMAQASGLEAARIGVWRTEDIAPAFESLTNKADALYVVSDALIAANRTLIVTLALSGRLPTMMHYDDYVAAGGLMSYGPVFPRSVPKGRRNGGQDSARHKTWRYSGGAADQVRVSHQRQDGGGSRPDNSADIPRHR